MTQIALDLNARDFGRITAQRARVLAFMWPGWWRTLAEISEATGDPEASVSARLRDLRKPAFGSYTVLRRRRYGANHGTYEYALEGGRT